MDNKKIVKQYLNKYFKQQYLEDTDHEFKSLVRILNKASKPVKKSSIPVVSNSDIENEFIVNEGGMSAWKTIIDRDNHFKRLGAKWMRDRINNTNT